LPSITRLRVVFQGALALLPRFVADRTTAIEVRDIEIP
jgi:hypothetical protein